MANDRFLIDYLPPYMQEYMEIKAIIQAEQPEIDALWSAVEKVFADQYIMDMTEYGVMRWEAILKISPKATDTLNERKFRILTCMNQELPYTLTKMKEALTTLCGADGFSIELQAAQYHIVVKLAVGSHSNYEEVQKLLKMMIPANMTQYVSIMYNQHASVGKLRHTDLATRTHEEIRSEVLTNG